ncbi:MAG: HDOD domain-containing protein [Hydrogenophilaceae bacterium]|nr:HDOD domain-containing protein [Hydrogenophilaceae bacterium]
MSDELDALDSKQTEQLLEELMSSQDFPALSSTIIKINQLVGSEESHTDELTRTILRDNSLTNKLLRLVNSVHYAQFGGRNISTISRAVVILGYNTIRDAALSLMLFEHLNNQAHAQALKSDALESFYCGVLGRLMSRPLGVRDVEEGFIGAMFRNLGRLMARLYFFERTERIRALMETEGLDENAACRKVLGTSYDQLGLAIGRHWHLPDTLMQGITPLPPGPLRKPTSDEARLQALANLARDLYEIAASNLNDSERLKKLKALSSKYAQAGELSPAQLHGAMLNAAEEVQKEAATLQASISSSAMLQRLLGEGGATAASAEAIAQKVDASRLDDLTLPEIDSSTATDPAAILTAGLQDLTNALISNTKITDVLHLLLEVYYRTGCFDRVMIAVLDRQGQFLAGRTGFGKNIDTAIGSFKVSATASTDAFSAAVAQGVDILISDTQADNIKSRIPAWHAGLLKAQSFLLLPITINKKPLALIYLDSDSGPITLAPQVLNMMKVLRNQALLAFKQGK